MLYYSKVWNWEEVVMLDFQQNISEKKSPRDSISESLFSIPYNESGTRPRKSLLGIGKEIIVPSSNIGLTIPPLEESNPFRLNITFIIPKNCIEIIKNTLTINTSDYNKTATNTFYLKGNRSFND